MWVGHSTRDAHTGTRRCPSQRLLFGKWVAPTPYCRIANAPNFVACGCRVPARMPTPAHATCPPRDYFSGLSPGAVGRIDAVLPDCECDQLRDVYVGQSGRDAYTACVACLARNTNRNAISRNYTTETWNESLANFSRRVGRAHPLDPHQYMPSTKRFYSHIHTA